MSSRRVKKYAKENFTGVMHTTLNPEGPGVVRIHLIPPVVEEGKEIGNSVAIINGQDYIPVGTAWTILLSELIKNVNEYSGRPVSPETVEEIKNKTVKGVRKAYPLLRKKIVKRDIYTIMHAFADIAAGREPETSIGQMSMGEYAPFMRAPHRMDLMISAMTKDGCWNCTQQCVHCYAAGQKQADEAELSTEEWKEIIDKCRAAGIPQVTFTGGEPTMRSDLAELIEHAAWFVTRLNTNGTLLTPELCKKLYDASLDSMQVTFYSKDAAVHNKLVGAEMYEQTVDGIKNALAAGINLSINTPLCTLNKDYKKTLEFLHELGVMYVTCSGLITTGNAETAESEALQLSTDEIKAILREAVEYAYANEMEISFTSPGWVENAFCEELGINAPTCGACLSNMAVTPGGNLVPCQSWLSGDVLGNMLTDNWETMWQSDVCKKQRDYSAKMLGQCPLRKYTKGGNAND